MARVRITCFDPVKAQDAFGYLMAVIWDGKTPITGREYDPGNFKSYPALEKHLCEWLRSHDVDRVELRFVSVKQSKKTGVQDVNQVGQTRSFNLGEDDLDFTDYIINLPN